MVREISEIEKELQEAKELEYIKRKKEKEELRKQIETDVYINDDYCGASIKGFSFYYGYEETYCKKHPKINDCEDRYDCEDREWCFTATIGNKDVMRIPSSKLSVDGNIEEYLISGMLLFIKEHFKN